MPKKEKSGPDPDALGRWVKSYESAAKSLNKFTDIGEYGLFHWLCVRATWKPGGYTYPTKYGVIKLKRGQFLISERTLAIACNVSRKVLRRMLRNLEEQQRITLNRDHSHTNAGTIVTINNYNSYQLTTAERDHKRDHQGTTKGPPRDQEEEGKKKDKEYNYTGSVIRLTKTDAQKLENKFWAIPDFIAEVDQLDAWYADPANSINLKNYWHRMNGALLKKHQRHIADGTGLKKPPTPTNTTADHTNKKNSKTKNGNGNRLPIGQDGIDYLYTQDEIRTRANQYRNCGADPRAIQVYPIYIEQVGQQTYCDLLGIAYHDPAELDEIFNE